MAENESRPIGAQTVEITVGLPSHPQNQHHDNKTIHHPTQKNQQSIQYQPSTQPSTQPPTQSSTQPKNQTQQENNVSYPNSSQSSQPTYAESMNQTNSDQAIIIETDHNLQFYDYLLAIGSLTDPMNILAASRLSKDRICVYFINKGIADEIAKKLFINVKGYQINIRPLITKYTKYFLSRVSPCINNKTLSEEIEKIINITSSIQTLKVGISDPRFSHIASFRRSFYGVPKKNIVIPEFININHNDQQYKIFISDSNSKCSVCSRYGHTNTNCQQNQNNRQTIEYDSIFDPTDNLISTTPINIPNNDNEKNDFPQLPQNNILSLSTQSTSTGITTPNISIVTTPKTKKLKEDENTKEENIDLQSIDSTSIPDKSIVTVPKTKKLKCEETAKEENAIFIKKFMELKFNKFFTFNKFYEAINTINREKNRNVINEYISVNGISIDKLVQIMEDMYNFAPRGMKYRLTTAKKKLLNSINAAEESDLSDDDVHSMESV